MRMVVGDASKNLGRLEVTIEHNNEEIIYWNVSTYERKNIESAIGIADHINAYWLTMSLDEQDKIYQCYSKIKGIIDVMTTTEALVIELTDIVAELLDLHDLDRIEEWVVFKSNIIISSDRFTEEYIEDRDTINSREKTYTKPDYRKLISLSIALRVMIPIWGEFINQTKNDTGEYKDMFACMLLDKSKLYHSVALEKLKLYINENIQMDKIMLTTVLKGISTDDYPQMTLASALIRRLCIGDLTGSNIKTTLITYIYNFITNKNGNGVGSLITSVRPKIFSSDSSRATEDTASKLEDYKMRQEITIGDTSIFSHFLNDAHKVLQLLRPSYTNVEHQLLDELLESIKVLWNEELKDFQITLSQYLIKRVLSPRAIVHLKKEEVLVNMAIAQTVMFSSNHVVLGCLLTARSNQNLDSEEHSGMSSRTRIPKETVEQIQTLFPFVKVPKQRVKSSGVKPKPNNTVITAIDNLSTDLGEHDWILTAPDRFIKEVTGRDKHRRYACPVGIKIFIANLILDLAKP